jgi:DNA-binding transcriptional MocR family regulator
VINPERGVTYQQIAAALRAEIMSGRIAAGRRLPSETTISQTYGVSRQTARSAVDVLRAEGLADLRRGAGVVVREPPERAALPVPPGAVVVSRMPTLDERAELSIAEGVPLLSVGLPDGSVEVYPADRWELRIPAS